MNNKNKENSLTEEEKEEAIKIIVLAEDKLFDLTKEKRKIEEKITELKKKNQL